MFRTTRIHFLCVLFVALTPHVLALNREVAARLTRAEPVTAPGIPPGFAKPGTLISEDCIRSLPTN